MILLLHSGNFSITMVDLIKSDSAFCGLADKLEKMADILIILADILIILADKLRFLTDKKRQSI